MVNSGIAECWRTFSDQKKPVSITPSIVRKVIQKFLLEHSPNTILSRKTI